MKVISTGDVSLDVLSEMIPSLSPEIELEVDQAQHQFRNFEPPSWITFLAQCDWWVYLLGAVGAGGAVFANAFLNAAGKAAGEDAWKHREKLLESIKSGGTTGIKKLAACIANLRDRLPERTQINIGIPFPDDRFPSIIQVAGLTPEDLELEITVFALHQPAISSLVESERLNQERLLGSLRFEILDDGSLQVSWMDADTMETITKTLALGPNPFVEQIPPAP